MKIDPRNLAGTWTHAHEEDERGRTVYRKDAELPPSRGRHQFELRPNHTAVERRPGASDAPVAGEATWSIADDGRTLVIDGTVQTHLTIESLSGGRMVVVRKE
jgi:hypothetical protein